MKETKLTSFNRKKRAKYTGTVIRLKSLAPPPLQYERAQIGILESEMGIQRI